MTDPYEYDPLDEQRVANSRAREEIGVRIVAAAVVLILGSCLGAAAFAALNWLFGV